MNKLLIIVSKHSEAHVSFRISIRIFILRMQTVKHQSLCTRMCVTKLAQGYIAI